MFQTLNEYELAMETPFKPVCNKCGKYISSIQHDKQTLKDGKDVYRIVYCQKCIEKCPEYYAQRRIINI